MSDQGQKPSDHQMQDEICMWADNDQNPAIIYCSFPIKKLAENTLGTIMVRGWIEEKVKGVVLSCIQKERMKAQKILTPNNGKLPILGVH